jgi:phospholipid/cholesterol/gamma-HCH transport system substrate-binding protein
MLTRLVRIQLILFTVGSIIAVSVLVGRYLQAPTLLGIGRISVTLELPSAGGLYQFSNVTYRGLQIGKVTAVDVTDDRHVQATLSLADSPKIPADLSAQVRSVSAVGEQYVDLQPRTDSPPYLHDGSVIALRDTSIPQRVGPMLDQLSALTGSLPKDKLNALLDETSRGFRGAGYDFGSLLDSTATLTGALNRAADQTGTLLDDSVPLLESQAQTADDTRTWARSLAGVTEQVTQDDPQLRTILQTGPGFTEEASRLLNQVKPTLPILLANLTSIGQIAVTYHASLEQLLVLLPPSVANTQAQGPTNNPTGLPLADFSLMTGDPPPCTVGFLPPSAWRSPADTTSIDTPDGLYCKLPQDSPIAVRGARNYPCMEHLGKRAPTVQLCDSGEGFEPLAMRQHVLGPYPLDPSLISQGIPPDQRSLPDPDLHGPPEGTPPPPGPSPGPDGAVTPNAFARSSTEPTPAVAFAEYNRRTGSYMAPDGHLYVQSDLAASPPKQWTDLVLGPR